MNAVVIYSRSKAESGMLHDAFRAIAGFRERDAWTVRRAATREELLQAVTDGAIAQICFADITGVSGLPIAEFVRRLFESAQLVLVVDSATPPTSYIRPGILPAGLLFKPLSLEAVRPLMQELLRIVRTRRQAEVFQDAAISVASHGSTYRIPLREVLYFEARNKKLYLYTRSRRLITRALEQRTTGNTFHLRRKLVKQPLSRRASNRRLLRLKSRSRMQT